MIPSAYDPYLLYTLDCMSSTSRCKKGPKGIFCLQTDDKAYTSNKAFSELEERLRRLFYSKTVQISDLYRTLKFNGGLVNFDGTKHTIKQPEHIKNLFLLDSKCFSAPHFISELSQGSYVTAVCRPDMMHAFSIASQFTKPKKICKESKQLHPYM